jgi:hypothetical protein
MLTDEIEKEPLLIGQKLDDQKRKCISSTISKYDGADQITSS